jgi:hypothetical protein
MISLEEERMHARNERSDHGVSSEFKVANPIEPDPPEKCGCGGERTGRRVGAPADTSMPDPRHGMPDRGMAHSNVAVSVSTGKTIPLSGEDAGALISVCAGW